MAEPFPEDVDRFLDKNVGSIDQLEILRVLGEDPNREWKAAALAQEIQAKPEEMGRHLAALRSRGLLITETREADLFCRWGPATPELENDLRKVLQFYRERPVSMIKLVYAQAADPLRNFADAFRLRGEEE